MARKRAPDPGETEAIFEMMTDVARAAGARPADLEWATPEDFALLADMHEKATGRLLARDPRATGRLGGAARAANTRAKKERAANFLRPLLAHGLTNEQLLLRADVHGLIEDLGVSETSFVRRYLTGLRKAMKKAGPT